MLESAFVLTFSFTNNARDTYTRYQLTADGGEGGRYTVDPTYKGNVARWINHSSVSANIVYVDPPPFVINDG
jgi:SET domain-containing protein